MQGNLSLSITACVDWGATCYERRREKNYISISGDHEHSVVGVSGSKLGPSGRGRPNVEKDLGEIEVQDGGIWLHTEDVFEMEGGSEMIRSGRSSRIDFGS